MQQIKHTHSTASIKTASLSYTHTYTFPQMPHAIHAYAHNHKGVAIAAGRWPSLACIHTNLTLSLTHTYIFIHIHIQMCNTMVALMRWQLLRTAAANALAIDCADQLTTKAYEWHFVHARSHSIKFIIRTVIAKNSSD